MADKKEFPLSIVIRAVDKATAWFTKPVGNLRKAFGTLGENLGVDRVGKAFGNVKDAIGGILAKFALVVGAAGAAGAALKSMIGTFDDLGDAAEKIGVSVDALAALRYAAERSGASVAELDGGLLTFSRTLTKARLGSGKLAELLKVASPALLEQLKKTKDSAQAFQLLANAMTRIKDPAKRTTLAVAAFGEGGAALVPLLARGGKGIDELTARFAKLAGPLGDAAGVAGAADDSFKDLGAASLGLKGVIVKGLGPVVTDLVKKLTDFIVANRDKIGAWIQDFAKKLPEAIQEIGSAVSGIIGFISKVVDFLGGFRNIAIGLAVVLAGKLVYAIGAFGVALATTPIGWFVAGIAALAAAVTLIVKNWGPISQWFSDLWLGIKETFRGAWEFIKGIVDAIVGAVDTVKKVAGDVLDFLNPLSKSNLQNIFSDADLRRMGMLPVQEIRHQGGVDVNTLQPTAVVKVDFANLPRGARVNADPRNTAEVDLSVGYQTLFP